MRKVIWSFVTKNLPEGVLLPWWALMVMGALFPLQFFYWRISNTTGYQWQTDTWKIDGATYSGRALWLLSKAQGEVYRVTRTGETVTLERLHGAEMTPTTKCWKCGDGDPTYTDVCQVPACGMREAP